MRGESSKEGEGKDVGPRLDAAKTLCMKGVGKVSKGHTSLSQILLNRGAYWSESVGKEVSSTPANCTPRGLQQNVLKGRQTCKKGDSLF